MTLGTVADNSVRCLLADAGETVGTRLSAKALALAGSRFRRLPVDTGSGPTRRGIRGFETKTK
jgi:hypothetical protein